MGDCVPEDRPRGSLWSKLSHLFSGGVGRQKTGSSSLIGSLYQRRLRAEPLENRQLLSVTLLVNPHLTPDPAVGIYATIQSAIDAANPEGGDTIHVVAETYNEFLTIDKSLTLESAPGNSTPPILSGDLIHVGISVDSERNVNLQGFIVDRWYQGILVQTASLRVENSSITNSIDLGVEAYEGGTVTLINSTLTHNNVAVQAGDVSTAGTVILRGDNLRDNSAGILVFPSGVASVTNSDLSGYAPNQAIINTNSAFMVDASGNYFGVDALLGKATAEFVVDKIGGNVDYSPWLESGTDFAGIPGFQGDFSVLSVSAGSAQVGATGRIQEAIDLVHSNGTIQVYGGVYHEQALNRDPYTGETVTGGTNFGVLVAKYGLTITGMDDRGVPIVSRSNLAATVVADSRDPSRGDIFISGDGVTMSGLKFQAPDVGGSLPAAFSSEIEIVGDAFVLQHSIVDNQNTGGSALYLHDPRSTFDLDSRTGTSHVRTFTIQDNEFCKGGIAISDGVGLTDSAAARIISGNLIQLVLDGTGLNLIGMGVLPDAIHPIGAITLAGNTFTENLVQIMFRDGTGFDAVPAWPAILANNTFDKAVVTWKPDHSDIEVSPVNPIDPDLPGKDVLQMVGTSIQGAFDRAQNGDTISVETGVYNEAVHVTTTGATLQGMPGAIIQPDNSTPLLDSGMRRAAIYIDQVEGVTINGIEIDGTRGNVHYGIYGFNSNRASILNTIIHDIQNETNASASDLTGTGLLLFGKNQGIDEGLIQNNIISHTDRRGIYVGGRQNFEPYSFLLSSNLRIEFNRVDHTWQEPTNDHGAALQINGAQQVSVLGNEISSTDSDQYGIYLRGSAGANNRLEQNEVAHNVFGIVLWSAASDVDFGSELPSAPVVVGNSIHDNATCGLESVDLPVNASGNWWGSLNGPTSLLNTWSGLPKGDRVLGDATIAPWLTDGTDDNESVPGFQPGSLDATSPSVTLDSTIAIDSGNPADRLTNDATPTFTGTAEVGATVALMEDDQVLGQTTTSDGLWSITSSFLADGDHHIVVRATDLAGNVAFTNELVITVDTNSPVAPNVRLTNDTGSSAADDITIDGRLTLSDLETGAMVEYSLDGTSWMGGFMAVEGENTVFVRQIDVAGNTSSVTTFAFLLDTVSPTLTATISEPSGSSWYNLTSGPAVITYTANDGDGSGVTNPDAYTFADGVDQSSPEITLADAAGNSVTYAAEYFFTEIDQDTVAPTLAATISEPAITGWYNLLSGPAVITYAASDTDGSGVTNPDAFTFADGANQTSPEITLTDVAGNSVTFAAGYFYTGIDQDTVAPTLTATISEPAGNGWYNLASGPAVITYAASDTDGSGVTNPDAYTFADGVDQSSPEITLTDAAGNSVNYSAGYFFTGIDQDTVVPTLAATISEPAGNGWYNLASGPAVITYAASDTDGSGVTNPDAYTFADGVDQSSPEITLTDAAGNSVNYSAGYFFTGIDQDTVVPTLAATISEPAGNGWYNLASGPAVITYAASDTDGSGVTNPDAFTFADGANQSSPEITLTDVAGNSVTFAAGYFYTGIDQDTVAPTLTATISEPAGSGWYNLTSGPAVITYTASDGDGSGVTNPNAYSFADGADQSSPEITLTDAAGNSVTYAAGYFYTGIDQDTVAPTLTATISEPALTGWYNLASGPAVFNYTANDSLSGLDPSSSATGRYIFEQGINLTHTFTVTDVAGNSSSVINTPVNVDLTCPVAEAGSNLTVDEGNSTALSGNYADPDSFGPCNRLWHLDSTTNGQVIADVIGDAFSFIPNDNGVYVFSYSVTDVAGNTGTDTVEVVVNNVSPHELVISGVNTSPEGTLITLTSSFFDPGVLDTFTYVWVVTSNNSQNGLIASGSGASFSFTPNDNLNDSKEPAAYTATLTVRDKDGGLSAQTKTISVTDVAPTIDLEGASTINEGSTYRLTLGAVHEPGILDLVTHYIVFWGDGSLPDDYTDPAGVKTHYYDDNAVVTGPISITLINGDGVYQYAGTQNLTVNDVPPTASVVNGGPVNEGLPVAVLFSNELDVSAADTNAGFTFGYDFNNDGDFTDPGEIASTTSASALVPAQYVQAPSSTIRMVIRDKDGGTSSYLTAIGVNNIAPVVNAGPDATAFSGIPWVQSGSFTDPGSENWVATVNYGDSTGGQPLILSGHNFTLNHTYAATGHTVDHYTVTVTINDGNGGISSDTVFVTTNNNTFRVTSFTTNASGFDVQFNRPVDLLPLNLYFSIDPSYPLADFHNSATHPANLPDIVVTGATTGSVAGNMVWNASTNTVSFVKTGGVLAADLYTVTLKSDANAWTDVVGSLLDGDGDFVAGGNYVNTFSVVSSTARVVSMPDFARGAGQTVNVPANGTYPNPDMRYPGTTLPISLPISINNAKSVLSVDLSINFDPTLLQINSAESWPGLPAGWSLTTNLLDNTTGLAKLSLFGPTVISAVDTSAFNLLLLHVEVPVTAPYGNSEVIKITNLRVNEGNIVAKADYAVHKAMYLGDADGSNVYTGFDPAVTSQVVVGLCTGFGQALWTDPVILADVTGDGTITGLDASYIAQRAAHLPRPEIPDLPVPALHLVDRTVGVDPYLCIARNIPAAPGSSITVPVDLTTFSGENVYSATFHVLFDPSQMSLTTVNSGSFWPQFGANKWTMVTNEDSAGDLLLVFFNSYPSDVGSGPIANLQFAINATIHGGTTPLELQPVEDQPGLIWTKSDGSLSFPTTVVNRRTFYDASRYDRSADDAAIATDKSALLPGQLATFANFTSYSHGLNGIFVDIQSLRIDAMIDTADFVFRVGKDDTPAAWETAPAPASISLLRGGGLFGSDRIKLIWDNNAIENEWLQVTVRGGDGTDTGLSQDDVFYFGNLIGESGDNAAVDVADELASRNNPSGFAAVVLTNPFDYNRDGRINATDDIIARHNSGYSLVLFTPATAAVAAKVTDVPVPDDSPDNVPPDADSAILPEATARNAIPTAITAALEPAAPTAVFVGDAETSLPSVGSVLTTAEVINRITIAPVGAVCVVDPRSETTKAIAIPTAAISPTSAIITEASNAAVPSGAFVWGGQTIVPSVPSVPMVATVPAPTSPGQDSLAPAFPSTVNVVSVSKVLPDPTLVPQAKRLSLPPGEQHSKSFFASLSSGKLRAYPENQVIPVTKRPSAVVGRSSPQLQDFSREQDDLRDRAEKPLSTKRVSVKEALFEDLEWVVDLARNAAGRPVETKAKMVKDAVDRFFARDDA